MKPKPKAKQWYRIVREGGRAGIYHLEGPIDVEYQNRIAVEMNARLGISLEMYEQADLLPEEDAHAFDMLEWERETSMKFFAEIVGCFSEGYFNDSLIKTAIRVVEGEFNDGDEKTALLEKLRAMPPRTICGSVEMWCEAAFSCFGFQRLAQCESKIRIMETIEKRFKAVKV